MFPALRQLVREFAGSLDSTPEPLSLKAGPGVTFDAINVDWYSRNGFPGIRNALGGGLPAWSGETVSVDTALNHSVVWACNRIISESVAFLPLMMMQETGRGKYPATHPMATALKNSPNDEMTAMEFRETLTSHCVLQGNAYAQIVRRSGTGVAVELNPIHPSQVRVERDTQKRLVYLIKEGTGPEKSYTVQKNKPQDILHVRGLGPDGVVGYSVITMARQSMGQGLAAEKFAGKFYANGGRVPYVLKTANKFKNQEDFDRFRADWENTYKEAHRAPILENGIEYQQTGLSLADAQFLETRQFNIPEICRWFLVSPHLVGDLSRATFSNIEQLALEFVKMTLMAWLVRWEQSLWRCVLTPDEKSQNLYFKHNVNSLLRGDFVSRMTGYASALQNGHVNIDEVRDLEDENPLPGGIGKDYRVQMNMQVVGAPPPAPAPLTAGKKPEVAA